MAKVVSKSRREGGKQKNPIENSSSTLGMHEKALRGVLAIVFFIVGTFFLLASLEAAGVVGTWVYEKLTLLLGIGYFLLPALLFILSATIFKTLEHSINIVKAVGAFMFVLAGLGLIELFVGRGGVVGAILTRQLVLLFDVYTTGVFLVGLLAIALILLLEAALLKSIVTLLRRLVERGTLSTLEYKSSPEIIVDGTALTEDASPVVGPTESTSPLVSTSTTGNSASPGTRKKEADDETMVPRTYPLATPFTPPPLTLLERDRGKPSVGDIKANTNTIKRTLQNFGITVEMAEVSIGPSVTRYALKPAEGVKLARIVGLKNDLALALAAHPIRIEAPIPGKSLVGLEIPNTTKSTVGLASLLSDEEYATSDRPLLIALGKSITGKAHFADLGKMPHLLIAGATGSGKSVTIHSIITSLLFRNPPETLGFVMVDPKRVELTAYDSIPHLLTPVITSAQQTIKVLRAAVKEMERRYGILNGAKVRDIESYHGNILAPAIAALETKRKKKGGSTEGDTEGLPAPMPYIVIIIDELADIMQAYPRELEAGIVRLAQMSRAVGIHLILSTQRPSVNVITGLIKANTPGRIALRVSSQIDSRTILDSGGAESLLGAGDMLYRSGESSKPHRLQSAFISEGEIKRVVEHLAGHYQGLAPHELTMGPETAGEAGGTNPLFAASLHDDSDVAEGDDDELYEQAREEVVKAGRASTSLLQRRLRIGYGRAARLVDMLEERGVVGPADGSKPRQVIGVPTGGYGAGATENI
jgi:S-DNA-T family DNA segregation ATPase FtsK/SpoIIIE